MAISISGNRGVVQELLKLGVKPKWATGEWLGPWTNQAQIDSHINWCKSVDVLPFFQFFYWGDEICLEALNGSFSPKEYGGQAETVAAYWTLAKLLADRIKASGRGALVSIESEWSKLGPNLPQNMGLHSVLDNPSIFDKVFADTAGIFHAAGAEVVTCPGQWSNLATLLPKFPKMVAATDYVATQGLNTLYHQTEANYIAGADRMLAKVKELQAGGGGKPILIADCAWSSYGGSYENAKPYKPIPPATPESNLRVGEAAQAKALARLRDLLPQLEAAGLKALFYRGLHDSRMDVKNWWGYFEWGWGVLRLDGTRKPGFDALLGLAAEPKTRTESEYGKVVQERDTALQTAELLQGRVETALKALKGS